MTNHPVRRRRRDLSQLISDALSVYSSPLLPKLVVLGIPTVVVGLVNLYVRLTLDPSVGWLISLPMIFVIGAMLGSGAIYFLDQLDRGNEVTIREALLTAWSRAGDLIGASLRSTIIGLLLLVTIVGIPFAIARWIRWAFTHEAIMVEGQRGEPSLGYSAAVVAGRGWPTAGFLIVIFMITGSLSSALALVFPSIIGDWPAGLLGVGLSLVIFPFSVVAHLMLYFDLRMRKAGDPTFEALNQ